MRQPRQAPIPRRPRSPAALPWLRASLLRLGASLSLLAASLLSPAASQSPAPQHAQTVPPGTPSPVHSQPDLAQPPSRWAEAAAASEDHILNYDTTTLLRYQIRRRDAKGEVLRQIVESQQGSVARLIEHNGKPLTADENAAERDRLQSILASPDAFLRRVRREEGSRTYATELLRSMPKAMLWSYTPGQPQRPGATGPAVVLDFEPDPKFKPPSLVTEGLTGIAGRLWIDADSRCVTRIQGRILHPIDFGWGGMLARIREGGSIELEQQRATDHRWLFSHLIEHITIREVLVHTSEENAEMSASAIQPLPSPPSFREAVQMLLAMPVPTR